jgi:hypothetical protein
MAYKACKKKWKNMSWFSFSDKKQDKVGPAPASQAKQRTHGMIWLDTSSEEVYQQTLDNLLKEVEEVSNYPKGVHANNATALAAAFLKKVGKLDRSWLSFDEKKTLASLVFRNFPIALSTLETNLTDLDNREYAVVEFGDTLRRLLENHIDRMPRKIPVPNQLNAVSPETARKAVDTVGSEESDQKLTAVTGLAAEAYKVATSVEDRFFAEQAANSYIPDSVRILSGLIHAPEDMKKEANELFMRQLEILESQLNGIVKRSASNSLSAMKAHTEFLETKKERLKLG